MGRFVVVLGLGSFRGLGVPVLFKLSVKVTFSFGLLTSSTKLSVCKLVETHIMTSITSLKRSIIFCSTSRQPIGTLHLLVYIVSHLNHYVV